MRPTCRSEKPPHPLTKTQNQGAGEDLYRLLYCRSPSTGISCVPSWLCPPSTTNSPGETSWHRAPGEGMRWGALTGPLEAHCPPLLQELFQDHPHLFKGCPCPSSLSPSLWTLEVTSWSREEPGALESWPSSATTPATTGAQLTLVTLCGHGLGAAQAALVVLDRCLETPSLHRDRHSPLAGMNALRF